MCCTLEIRKWVRAVWGIVGILIFFEGIRFVNFDMFVVGVVLAYGYALLDLTSFERSDHIVKRALEVFFVLLEVFFVLLAFGTVVYGYIVTGSFILGIMTIFIVSVDFVAFLLSHLRARAR